jgi:hypothetical protein
VKRRECDHPSSGVGCDQERINSGNAAAHAARAVVEDSLERREIESGARRSRHAAKVQSALVRVVVCLFAPGVAMRMTVLRSVGVRMLVLVDGVFASVGMGMLEGVL